MKIARKNQQNTLSDVEVGAVFEYRQMIAMKIAYEKGGPEDNNFRVVVLQPPPFSIGEISVGDVMKIPGHEEVEFPTTEWELTF